MVVAVIGTYSLLGMVDMFMAEVKSTVAIASIDWKICSMHARILPRIVACIYCVLRRLWRLWLYCRAAVLPCCRLPCRRAAVPLSLLILAPYLQLATTSRSRSGIIYIILGAANQGARDWAFSYSDCFIAPPNGRRVEPCDMEMPSKTTAAASRLTCNRPVVREDICVDKLGE